MKARPVGGGQGRAAVARPQAGVPHICCDGEQESLETTDAFAGITRGFCPGVPRPGTPSMVREKGPSTSRHFLSEAGRGQLFLTGRASAAQSTEPAGPSQETGRTPSL